MAKPIGHLLFEDVDDDPSDENLDDLLVGERSLAGAVLYNTDWTVETIVGQIVKKSIDLSPSFQRRDAWSLNKKSLFIESILLNFPVPPLTLAEKGNTKKYIVVDGKQRLTTLSQFFGIMNESSKNAFKLSGLNELPNLNGLNLEEIRRRYPTHISSLENYTIRTNVIRGWSKDEVLYSIFLRLNSGSVKLSPQELRQALSPGSCANWLLDYSENSTALRSIFPGPEPDFRMRDVELLLRYLGFHFFIEDYRGNLKAFLDQTMDRLNHSWEEMRPSVKLASSLFESSYLAVVEVFGEDHAFRKWTGFRWENRLNRAIFDLMMFHLSDEKSIIKFREVGGNCVEAFKKLCEQNDEFRTSIETTTKSIEAVYNRMFLWGEQLQRLGIIDINLTDIRQDKQC